MSFVHYLQRLANVTKIAKFNLLSIYTSNKPADIFQEILIHVYASDLNSVKCLLLSFFKFAYLFFIYFHQKKKKKKKKKTLDAVSESSTQAQ